jgi:hypothetical protein
LSLSNCVADSLGLPDLLGYNPIGLTYQHVQNLNEKPECFCSEGPHFVGAVSLIVCSVPKYLPDPSVLDPWVCLDWVFIARMPLSHSHLDLCICLFFSV